VIFRKASADFPRSTWFGRLIVTAVLVVVTRRSNRAVPHMFVAKSAGALVEVFGELSYLPNVSVNGALGRLL
jgi:hypothetical protein